MAVCSEWRNLVQNPEKYTEIDHYELMTFLMLAHPYLTTNNHQNETKHADYNSNIIALIVLVRTYIKVKTETQVGCVV